MYEANLLSRIRNLGLRNIIVSVDTISGIVVFFLVYMWTNGVISESEASQLLTSFATVSASLFAIVLTGLTIITSFTDKLFVYAWKEVEEYDNIITTFQYNLYLPMITVILSLGLNHIIYSNIATIFTVAFFVYMLISLLDLVNLVSKYALQRGEFIKQQLDRDTSEKSRSSNLTNEEMQRVVHQLNRLRELERESEKEKE